MNALGEPFLTLEKEEVSDTQFFLEGKESPQLTRLSEKREKRTPDCRKRGVISLIGRRKVKRTSGPVHQFSRGGRSCAHQGLLQKGNAYRLSTKEDVESSVSRGRAHP